MKYKVTENNEITIDDMDNSFFLVGLLNAFMNRFQAAADSFFEDISWKQCFLIICIQLFPNPPSINELAKAIGSSHQNVKQMLNKMESIGFVEAIPDKEDKRKQRIILTKKSLNYNEDNAIACAKIMSTLFENIDPAELATTVKTISLLDEKIRMMRTEMSQENPSEE